MRLARPEPILLEEPALPEFEELIVVADSVVGLQVETSITSDHARIEDEVVARVTRDVRVGDRVAIPAGAKAHGEVTLVERGGRLRDRARLAVRFTSVVFADGTSVPLETDTIYREGDARSRESASRIGGGAIGGAIIGGFLGAPRAPSSADRRAPVRAPRQCLRADGTPRAFPRHAHHRPPHRTHDRHGSRSKYQPGSSGLRV